MHLRDRFPSFAVAVILFTANNVVTSVSRPACDRAFAARTLGALVAR